MDIHPFGTEVYFDRYEFTCPYLVSASDCETMEIAELLRLAGRSVEELASVTLGYAPVRGTNELRERIAASYRGIEPEQIVVTSAPEEGIYTLMRALLEPGDDVVITVPCYDSMLRVPEHIGSRMHPWAIRPQQDGWAIDLDELAALLRVHQPKLVIVNFPHNPTGYLPSVADFRAMVEMVTSTGAWLFCDEMYRGLELDSSQRLPSGPELHPRCIALGGLSKAYGLPGLRTGWLVIHDAELRERVVGWKLYTTICAPTPTQWLASVSLGVADQLFARNIDIIRRNRDLADQFFARWHSQFTWRPPVAGSVALVDTALADATEYCHALARDAGIVLLPGDCLGADKSYVRIGLGRNNLDAGLVAWERALEAVALGETARRPADRADPLASPYLQR